MTQQVHSGTGATQQKPSSAYRKLRRKFAQTRARMPLVWLRHRNFCSSDVFFASYPKSGTTWVRFALFEMLTGLPAGFRLTNQLMPEVGDHPKASRLLPGSGRLIPTHEHYRKEYHRAIYLVRDARDVLLSEFEFLKALDFVRDDLDEFISNFLLTRVSIFGPWQRHVSTWLDSPIAKTENLLLVRFEDVRQNPTVWFRRMAEFLGVEIDDDKIELAVANNSLESMREKERREPVRASIRARFVRNGAVRGWVSKLSPTQLSFIEQHTSSTLLRLGYPLSDQPRTAASASSRALLSAM